MVPEEHLDILAGALEVNGALPVLKTLSVKFNDTPGVILMLTRALVGGALPALEHLEVTQHHANSWTHVENDQVNSAAFNSLADMLERRAHIPGCSRLKSFNAHDSGLEITNSATQARCLRALLPSVEFFKELRWEADFEPCFRDVQPPLLQDLCVGVKVDGGAFPSLEVLEALPAVRKLELKYIGEPYNGFDVNPEAFQPVIAALHRNIGLQTLQEVSLESCVLGEGFKNFVHALGGSSCANYLATLSFTFCGIGLEGARTLADLIRQDGLPALENLDLEGNRGIQDEGVVALAEALRGAPRTLLKTLSFKKVRMCDEGMMAFASAVHQGRMELLEALDLNKNKGVTDKGVKPWPEPSTNAGCLSWTHSRWGGFPGTRCRPEGLVQLYMPLSEGARELHLFMWNALRTMKR